MEISYDRDSKERVPFAYYLERYRKADPEEICRRTGAAWSEEEKTFSLNFLGLDYRICFPDFEVRPLLDGGQGAKQRTVFPLCTMNDARILVIRFLLEGCSSFSTGRFLTFREVPSGEVYDRQFHGRCVQRLARTYGNRLELFSHLMERLGAKKIKDGDSGYETELLDGYLIRFQLWAGDEEFPPSSQILFSDNFAAGFRAEDLVVACDVILNTMKELSFGLAS